MSVIDDINKKRTRQSVGEAVQTVKSGMGNVMGDQAGARVSAGKQSGSSEAARGNLNPTAEQETVAKAMMNPAIQSANDGKAPVESKVPETPTTKSANDGKAPVESKMPETPTTEPETPTTKPANDGKAPAESKVPETPTTKPVTTYTDITRAMHPELDAEAVAKREKQLRTKKKVAAIGDAISALANMHYTGTSGVNAYDPSATLSGKAKERYDKFLSDVKEYEDAHKASMLRGAEKDAATTEARRKEAKADQRYEEQKETAAAAAKQAQENWEKQFEAEQAHKAETLKLQKQINEDNTKIREEANRIREKYQDEKAIQKMTNDFYGKPYVFKSSDGKQVVIYDRVWRKNMPQIFEMLKAEKVGRGTMGDFMYNMQFDKMTPQEIENWVNANWHKSPAVVAEMEELAKNTPESFRATQTKSEDWSQYAVGGDDYSQYIVE